MTKVGLLYYWNDNVVLRNETKRNKEKGNFPLYNGSKKHILFAF